MHQRRQIEAEQMLRPQRGDVPGAGGEEIGGDQPGIGDARQQQGIGPDGEADAHAGDRAGGGGTAPDQTANERGRELRHRGERQQADRGELGVAGRAIIEIGEHHDAEDRQPAHLQHGRTEIVRAFGRAAPVEQERHHDVVRHHDRQRDRLDDHHRGRRRKAADERRQRQHMRVGGERQSEHEHVAVDAAGREHDQAGNGDRDHEQVDQHQISGEQPGRAPHLVDIVVLDHGHMKLARDQHEGEERQQRHRRPGIDMQVARQDRGDARNAHRLGEQGDRSVEHPERDEDANREEGDQFDGGFRGDRQHQSVLVLGGVHMTRAEQNGEGRHRHRDEQGNVAEHRRAAGVDIDLRGDGLQRGGHRFELQSDIGDAADDGDHRHAGGDALAFAVAGGDEVGDRGDVLRLGEPDHPHQQRPEQANHQDRTDIDRQEVESGARGKADRAEEGPGRAVDRQRQRIDQQARAGVAHRATAAVAIARDQEQQPDIAERDRDKDPALQHDFSRQGNGIPIRHPCAVSMRRPVRS